MVPGATDFNTQIRDNLNQLKSPSFARTACNSTAAASINTTSTVWTAISAALSLTLTTYGGALQCGLAGEIGGNAGYLAFEVDGTAYTGLHPSGIFKAGVGGFFVSDWITDVTASGSHTIRPVWRSINGATTVGLQWSGQPLIFWVREG